MKQNKVIIISAVITVLGAILVILYLSRGKTPVPVPSEIPAVTGKPDASVTSLPQEDLREFPERDFEPVEFSYKFKNKESAKYQVSLQTTTRMNLDFIMAAMQASVREEDQQGSLRLDLLNNEPSKLSSDFSATLNLKFYQRNDSFSVGAVLTDISLKTDHEKNGLLLAIEQPFTFVIDSKGFIDNFQFTKGTEDISHAFLKNLLYSMQVAFPQSA